MTQLALCLRYKPKGLDILVHRHLISRVHSHFTVSGKWKQLKCPSADEWIINIWHLCSVSCYSSLKDNEIMKCSSQSMGLDWKYYIEWGNPYSERDSTGMFCIYGSVFMALSVLVWVHMTKVTAEAKEAEVPWDEGEKEL